MEEKGWIYYDHTCSFPFPPPHIASLPVEITLQPTTFLKQRASPSSTLFSGGGRKDGPIISSTDSRPTLFVLGSRGKEAALPFHVTLCPLESL